MRQLMRWGLAGVACGVLAFMGCFRGRKPAAQKPAATPSFLASSAKYRSTYATRLAYVTSGDEEMTLTTPAARPAATPSTPAPVVSRYALIHEARTRRQTTPIAEVQVQRVSNPYRNTHSRSIARQTRTAEVLAMRESVISARSVRSGHADILCGKEEVALLSFPRPVVRPRPMRHPAARPSTPELDLIGRRTTTQTPAAPHAQPRTAPTVAASSHKRSRRTLDVMPEVSWVDSHSARRALPESTYRIFQTP